MCTVNKPAHISTADSIQCANRCNHPSSKGTYNNAAVTGVRDGQMHSDALWQQLIIICVSFHVRNSRKLQRATRSEIGDDTSSKHLLNPGSIIYRSRDTRTK